MPRRGKLLRKRRPHSLCTPKRCFESCSCLRRSLPQRRRQKIIIPGRNRRLSKLLQCGPSNSIGPCSHRDDPIPHVGMTGNAVKLPGLIVGDHRFRFRELPIRLNPLYPFMREPHESVHFVPSSRWRARLYHFSFYLNKSVSAARNSANTLDSWIEIRKQEYFNKQAVTSGRS